MKLCWTKACLPLLFVLADSAAILGSSKRKVSLVADPHKNHSLSVSKKPNNELWIECGAHIPEHPDSIVCPPACPYLRMEPTRFCEFKCVQADACNDDDPLSNFADPKTLRCSSCHVAACRRCNKQSADLCDVCQEGFFQQDGFCVSHNRYVWFSLYITIAIGASIGFIYVVKLVLRPTINDAALAQGQLFRASSKTRDPATNELYALDHDIRNDETLAEAVGIGVMLNFRFQAWALTWAFCIMCVLLGLRLMFDDREAAQKHTVSSEKSFEACNSAVTQQQDNIVFMEQAFFWAVLIIYIGSFIATIVFAVRQRKFFKKTSDHLITMQDYALRATGLPHDSGAEDVEASLKQFFASELKDVPDLDLVGVTVCWNYRKRLDEVKDHAVKDLEEWDIQHEEKDCAEPMHQGESDRKTQSGRRTVDEKSSLADLEEKRRVTCCDPSMQCIDFAFGVGSMPCTLPTDEEEPVKRSETVEGLVSELESSGTAFIVFRTEKQRKQALEAWGKQKRTYKESEVLLEEADLDPETVLWDGFGASDLDFQMMLVKGILFVILSIVILDVFFYAPYVAYLISYSNVAGMTQGGIVQGILLGLLITVCNQIIYAVITWRADLTPFCSRGRQQQFYVVGYTWAIFFNTCVDLMTVMLLAKGYSSDQALKMQVAQDSTMSAKSMAESPSMQRSIYVQLVAYLFPGCLLAPFLLEPIAAAVIPYFLGYNLVRSRKEVSMQDAEGLLACAPFDLSRYGDILINIMLCILTLFFTYREIWMIWVYLIISLIVILCWDHCRLLRYSQHSFFGSPLMAYTSHYLLAFPCGLLAAVLAFRVWGAQDDGFLEGHDALQRVEGLLGSSAGMNRETIFWSMGVCFSVHILVHFSILRWIVPRFTDVAEEHSDEVPYEVTASKIPCNWFNSNPVHVLRSQHFFKDGKEPGDHPCVQFQAGKEYLLKANPKIGLYYEKTKEDIVKEIEVEQSKRDFGQFKSLGVRAGVKSMMKSGA